MPIERTVSNEKVANNVSPIVATRVSIVTTDDVIGANREIAEVRRLLIGIKVVLAKRALPADNTVKVIGAVAVNVISKV
jgi:hypothetical protein